MLFLCANKRDFIYSGFIRSSSIRSSSRTAVRLTGLRSVSHAQIVGIATPSSWARSVWVQPRRCRKSRSSAPLQTRSDVATADIIHSIYSSLYGRTIIICKNVIGKKKNLRQIAFIATFTLEQKSGTEERAAKQYPRCRNATHPIKERVMLNVFAPHQSVKHCPACGADERIETGSCRECDLPLIQPTDLRKHLAAAAGMTELHQQLERAV